MSADGESHPETCPWCGRDRIRGILPSPDGNRWYRCVACATTFFLRVTSPSRRALKGKDRGPADPAKWSAAPR
jgi:transposase-like protein